MAQQRRLQALRNDRELARFVVEGRATGKQLGTGSYGSVEEVAMAEALLNSSNLKLMAGVEAEHSAVCRGL